MGAIRTGAWRVAGLAVGLVAVVLLVGAVGSWADAQNGARWTTWVLAGAGAFFGWLARVVWKMPEAAAAVGAARYAPAEEAAAYFRLVNETREFPPSPTQRVISRPGRPVLAACDAELVEMATQTVRGAVGTRVKVGGVPIYLGGSVPQSRVVRKDAVRGELAATTHALVFNGATRTLEIPWAKVQAVETGRDCFAVSSSDRATPILFVVTNGLLWGILVKNLTQFEMNSRRLPDGANLVPL